jgi:hypothetical protein
LHQRAQSAGLDLRQGNPLSFVTNQIARFLEQVHELLARRELHAVSESPLVLLGIHGLAGRALAILRAPIFRLIVGGPLDPIFRPLSRR